jgi:hypothetical protein
MDPVKLVNATSGKSIFCFVLPKLVAVGDISSLIIFLLSSLVNRPNFCSELDLLRSLSFSRFSLSLNYTTRE